MAEQIIVFHAGSLRMVLEQAAEEFEAAHPGIKIQLEGSGARKAARKVTDEHKPCDIVASADYQIIEDLLKPEYADFNIVFARNKLVISYSEKSQYYDKINADNWFNILLMPGVRYGHTDPELDPAGYRARLCWQLAEKHYNVKGLYEALKTNIAVEDILTDAAIIRQKILSGELDYFFGYASSAAQNGYRFIALPDAINFSSSEYIPYYRQAELMLAGKEQGTQMKVIGQPILYGITLLKTAPNYAVASCFLEFLLDRAETFVKAAGLVPLFPPVVAAKDYQYLPPSLTQLVMKGK